MTDSLVLHLQQDASTSAVPLPDVLRKARIVATKLKLDEMNSWIEKELHGYPEDAEVPDYRVLHGDVRAHNPVNGLLIPIRFGAPGVQEKLSTLQVRQSIGGLHELLVGEHTYLQVQFSEQLAVAIRDAIGPEARSWLVPFRKLEKPHVAAIFDAVRNRILDWTLKLEAKGILGEGLTFSPQEKKAAQHVVFNINNSTIDQLNTSGKNIKGKA